MHDVFDICVTSISFMTYLCLLQKPIASEGKSGTKQLQPNLQH